SDDGVAHLWTLESGGPIDTLDDQPGGVDGVAFSADGSRMLSWNRAGSVWMRDTRSLSPMLRLDLGETVECAAFTPDGEVIAAGGAGAQIAMWRSDDGTELTAGQLQIGGSSIRAIAFSPDSEVCATGHIN